MNGPNQPEINLLLPAVSPVLEEGTAKALHDLWQATIDWHAGFPPATPVLDEFRAVRHDVAAVEVNRLRRREEDPVLPVRSDCEELEQFRGRHGSLIVVKGK
jgi:hypothetical protein